MQPTAGRQVWRGMKSQVKTESKIKRQSRAEQPNHLRCVKSGEHFSHIIRVNKKPPHKHLTSPVFVNVSNLSGLRDGLSLQTVRGVDCQNIDDNRTAKSTY